MLILYKDQMFLTLNTFGEKSQPKFLLPEFIIGNFN